MTDIYGTVEGPRPGRIEDAIQTDPFECLLGLCRVMGLRYEVTEHNGRWSGKVTTPKGWPGDFFNTGTARGECGSERSFTYANATTRRDAIFWAINMAYGELERSARHWRGIVADQPKYKDWFPRASETEG